MNQSRRASNRRDLRTNQPTASSEVPTSLPSARESYAAISGSLQATYGNTEVLGALSGSGSSLDPLISGTLTLASSGVELGACAADLWTPSAAGTIARESDGGEVSAHAAARVGRALGGHGDPLPPAIAARLSVAFGGADLSKVRVHTGPTAVAAAQAIAARAFTVGTDIVFGREGFHPETDAGLALLAHELTHVIQHQEGRLGAQSGGGMAVSSPTDATEIEAESSSRDVVAAMPDIESAQQADSLADIDPYAYMAYPGESAPEQSPAQPPTDGVVSRADEEDERGKAKPAVEGKKLGVWTELTSADLFGGHEIPPPKKGEDGIASYQEALAWGATKVVGAGAQGGVVVKSGDRYYVFTMVVKTWIYDFTRANVEDGIDSVTLQGSEVSGIQSFLTTDGHVVPVTVNRSNSTSQPVHIVNRDLAGGYWHATSVPDASGYAELAKQAEDGQLDELSGDEAVALFKGMVKSNAIAQIEENRKKVAEIEATYQPGSRKAENDPHWQRLRELSEKDQILAAKQGQLEGQIRDNDRNTTLVLALPLVAVGMLLSGSSLFQELQTKNQELQARVDEIKQIRASLRRAYPELGTVDTASATPTTTNAALFEGMQEKFKALRAELDKLHTSIHEDDTPISKLGPLVAQTKAQLGVGDAGEVTKFGAHVNEWLASEDLTEKVISFGGALVGIVLGVGAVIATGGWAVVLGLAGAGVGVGTAVYDFDRADDLYTASKAGVGGSQFVDDPEAARFNYIMGWVNLCLAGLDLGLAIKAGTTTLRGAQAAEAMMGMAGSDVLAKVKPEQIIDFKKLAELRKAGKGAEADALAAMLKGKLGEETFEAANKLFGKSALLEELFGASAKVSAEAKAALSGLSDDLLRQVAGKGDDFAEQVGGLLRKIGKDMEPDALARLAMEVDPATLIALERKVGGRAVATLGNTFEPKTLKSLSAAELEELGLAAQKDPSKFTRLNLGSGRNPMTGAINMDVSPAQGVDLVGDANKLGLKPASMSEVHAVNPFGFNPVSRETARVMKPNGLLYVTGTARNNFAKAASKEQAFEAGFEIVETTTGIHPAHQFGVQTLANGNPLNTTSSTTTIYRKLP